MKKLLLSLLGCATLVGTAYARDEKITRGYNSNDSLGCMILHVLGGIYREIESGLDRAVNIRFGLPPGLPESVQRSIKRADRMAAWLEATQLAGFSEAEAAKIFIKPAGTPANIRLRPQSPDDASASFLRRFSILGGYKKQAK